MSIMSKQVNKN